MSPDYETRAGKPQVDPSKLSDFEISVLVMERDVAQYRAGKIDELLNQIGRAKGFIDADKQESPSAKGGFVKEVTFDALKFDEQKGDCLGNYEVAFKSKNLPDKFSPAYGILRQNNATIKNRYHGPNYAHSYWLYSESRIYRQNIKKSTSKTEQVKAKFPSDLRELLNFERKGGGVIIKPKAYLGSDNFGKIAKIVRDSNGEYVSAGKNSHFNVPIDFQK